MMHFRDKVESIVACECECSVHPDGGRPSRTWSDCNEDMRKGQENRRTREKVEAAVLMCSVLRHSTSIPSRGAHISRKSRDAHLARKAW